MRLPTTTPISASLTMIPGAIRLRNKSISLAFLGSNGHDNRGCRNEQPQRSARPLRAARGARNRGREWNGDHVKAVMSQCSHLVSNQSRRQTAQRQQRHGSAGQDSARPGLSVGWWLSVGRARTQRSGLSGAEILGGGSAGGSHPHHVARVRTGTGGWCRGHRPHPAVAMSLVSRTSVVPWLPRRPLRPSGACRPLLAETCRGCNFAALVRGRLGVGPLRPFSAHVYPPSGRNTAKKRLARFRGADRRPQLRRLRGRATAHEQGAPKDLLRHLPVAPTAAQPRSAPRVDAHGERGDGAPGPARPGTLRASSAA
jgi:hypothetical protein